MLLEYLFYDPMFWLGILVLVSMIAFFAWSASRERERKLEERLRRLEKELEKKESS